ncbi:hypothetical protein B566_EDAN000464 [Ephemera danica]|nr:hypothetical protein B566_EDAN000464 [Ephemera danica]
MALLLVVSLSIAEQSFFEQYERGYNIFNPANQYMPDNPFNPVNQYHPDNPLNPANRYNPNTPFVPLNRSR